MLDIMEPIIIDPVFSQEPLVPHVEAMQSDTPTSYRLKYGRYKLSCGKSAAKRALATYKVGDLGDKLIISMAIHATLAMVDGFWRRVSRAINSERAGGGESVRLFGFFFGLLKTPPKRTPKNPKNSFGFVHSKNQDRSIAGKTSDLEYV